MVYHKMQLRAPSCAASGIPPTMRSKTARSEMHFVMQDESMKQEGRTKQN